MRKIREESVQSVMILTFEGFWEYVLSDTGLMSSNGIVIF